MKASDIISASDAIIISQSVTANNEIGKINEAIQRRAAMGFFSSTVQVESVDKVIPVLEASGYMAKRKLYTSDTIEISWGQMNNQQE